MNEYPRLAASSLTGPAIPLNPGVYAWYRDGEAIYVGKAGNLHQRVWKNHMGRGVGMTGSAFRRNVAANLGISTPAAIKSRAYVPTREEADAVVAWIRECEVAWTVCETDADALGLEARMKTEWMPPLTKM
jgi:excinuclease UvrABC nuclease subunit